MNFLDRPLVITDLETTGLIPGFHEIIEVGVVVVDQRTLEVITLFESRVMPEYPERATPEAVSVNGFDVKLWKDAPNLQSVMKLYSALTKDGVFSSHNITFDWPFIEQAFKKTGVSDLMDYHRVDLFTIAWERLRNSGIGRFNLKYLCEHLGVDPEPEVHSALNGAFAAYQVLKKLLS